MHLWLLFQLLVIKGAIIVTASNVLWWWAAIFPLITPSQSLIYCQPSSLCHAAISCLRGRELAWKMEKNQTGERLDWGWWMHAWWIRRQPPSTEASECEWVFFFLLHNIVLKQEGKRASGKEKTKRGHMCATHFCRHTCRFDVSSSMQ